MHLLHLQLVTRWVARVGVGGKGGCGWQGWVWVVRVGVGGKGKGGRGSVLVSDV